jgi:hypothetical protein
MKFALLLLGITIGCSNAQQFKVGEIREKINNGYVDERRVTFNHEKNIVTVPLRETFIGTPSLR